MRLLYAFFVIFVLVNATSAFAVGGETMRRKAWVVYVAIEPEKAYLENMSKFNYKFDIKKFKYPLYVGYFYSTDSSSVRWRCFEPIAEPQMKEWAERQNKFGGAVSFDVRVPYNGKKISFDFSDEEYVELIGPDISRAGMHAIKVVVCEKPNEAWRPQFKHQYSINISLDKGNQNFLEMLWKLRQIVPDDGWELTNK
jgi:hypothetical protein